MLVSGMTCFSIIDAVNYQGPLTIARGYESRTSDVTSPYRIKAMEINRKYEPLRAQNVKFL